MIEVLEGTLLAKSPQKVVLNIGGVGFGVQIPASTFHALPDEGENCRLWTFLAVRENEINFYGFATREERELFLILQGVKNVGGRTALDILSHVSPDRFVGAIVAEDLVSLTRIPGIGKKTAERLIFELKEKITKLEIEPEAAAAASKIPLGSLAEEAVKGLIFLGCNLSVAQRAVTKAHEIVGPDAPVEILIKEALKHR